MDLLRGAELVGADVEDGPAIDVSWRKVSSGDESAKPAGAVGVMVVVIGAHGIALRSVSKGMPVALARRFSVSSDGRRRPAARS